jgi:hypothetical protein
MYACEPLKTKSKNLGEMYIVCYRDDMLVCQNNSAYRFTDVFRFTVDLARHFNSDLFYNTCKVESNITIDKLKEKYDFNKYDVFKCKRLELHPENKDIDAFCKITNKPLPLSISECLKYVGKEIGQNIFSIHNKDGITLSPSDLWHETGLTRQHKIYAALSDTLECITESVHPPRIIEGGPLKIFDTFCKKPLINALNKLDMKPYSSEKLVECVKLDAITVAIDFTEKFCDKVRAEIKKQLPNILANVYGENWSDELCALNININDFIEAITNDIRLGYKIELDMSTKNIL